ncbi:MAG: hypothetical protein GXO61_04570 [Epsilonproteobacteria bacterium]|nr:hypothetical protein [Campylobacterota bacterium]
MILKFLILGSLIITNTFANHLFSLNITCKECHPKIYQEYQNSMHSKATIFSDPIHRQVWEVLPFSRRGEYSCAYCHTPAANNLEELVKPNGIAPQERNPTQNDSIACAYCHRIVDVEKGDIHNFNIVSPEQRVYFGRKKLSTDPLYHKVVTTNPLYKNGNNCLGCHGHYSNKYGIEIYTSSPNLPQVNCVKCHMPQVKGSSNTFIDTKTHAYHGSFKEVIKEKIKEYLSLKLEPLKDGFKVLLISKVPHIVLTTPLKSLYLSIDVIRNNKIVFNKDEFFVRALSDKTKQVAIPWFAQEVLIDNMLQPNETREFYYNFKLQKGDKVVLILSKVLLGYEIQKDETGHPTIKEIKIKGKPEVLVTQVFPIK